MERQTKIINKIKHNNGQNKNRLQELITNPNDECFTSMSDIWTELLHWTSKFKNKNILCPCDWDIIEDDEDIYSIRIDFDRNEIHGHLNNIRSVELKKFYKNDITTQKIVNQKQIEQILSNSLKCNFIRTLIQNNKIFKCKSITASGYNPKTQKGIKFQDVDFKKYDICVTNPPFSLSKEFMEKLISSKIKFIVLAPFLNRINISIGLPLFLKQAYLGFGRHLGLNFYNPNSTNKYKSKIVCVDWVVSWPDAQNKIDAIHYKNGFLYDKYKNDFEIMENMTLKDGTHPIKVNSIGAIPDDYYGWMFVSAAFLDKFSLLDFEWFPIGSAKYFNKNKDQNPLKHEITSKAFYKNGKKQFGGFLVRRIKK